MYVLLSLKCDDVSPARSPALKLGASSMPKKTKKVARREWTAADVKSLRAHSEARTPVAIIAKLTKRSVPSLRMKASSLGIGLGHQR
jgi:hypothetical protein